ncbi:hypothetical protein F4808DRAFT_334770 [Astrocystis sublimbata]|nr:hypothetical protein F4808DRAFT_334770 [Astrocystis sublimbata]
MVGKKKGPKPFLGSRRKRCDLRVPPKKPLVHPLFNYSRKLKTDVLLWLTDNRVPVTQTNTAQGPYFVSANANRRNQSAMTEEDRDALIEALRGNGVIYRPPSIKEAAAHWQVDKDFIRDWWANRRDFLSPEDYDRSNKLPIYEAVPGGAGLANSAPRPQLLPQVVASATDSNTPDANDDNVNGAENAEKSPNNVIEISDAPDSDVDELPELDTEMRDREHDSLFSEDEDDEGAPEGGVTA